MEEEKQTLIYELISTVLATLFRFPLKQYTQIEWNNLGFNVGIHLCYTIIQLTEIENVIV